VSLLVFLLPSVSVSIFHSHIKMMGKLKYYKLSINTVFGLSVVSEHCSDFPEFVKIYLFSAMFFASKYEISHSKYMNIFSCYNILFITTLLLIGICPLNNITLDFSGYIFIPDCFIVLYKAYSVLCKSFSESDKNSWSSANSSVLSTVSLFISIQFDYI